MENILDMAQYLFDAYKKQTGETIDEMKMHKLLYFAQREAIAITGNPMTADKFEGWIHGPVCRKVRFHFSCEGIEAETKPVSDEAAYILNNVILEYGRYDSWALREMSHHEISWKNARKGLLPKQPGNQILSLSDIREDAKKVRPYDHVWDMYYDEFEDVDGE